MRPFHKRTEGRLDLDRRRGLPVTNAFPVTNAAGAAPPLRREKRDDRVRVDVASATMVATTCSEKQRNENDNTYIWPSV
jgi:hypothetical protein